MRSQRATGMNEDRVIGFSLLVEWMNEFTKKRTSKQMHKQIEQMNKRMHE